MVGTPSKAQIVTWVKARDLLPGPQRALLMQGCVIGRYRNLRGQSYFDPLEMSRRKDFLLQAGSEKNVDAVMSGQATALAIACPTVW